MAISYKRLWKLLVNKVGILSSRTVNEVMIVGGGRITYYLTNMLLELGMDVKIIEINKDKCVNIGTHSQ